MENRVPPRQEKKEVADRDEVALEKEIQEHLAWVINFFLRKVFHLISFKLHTIFYILSIKRHQEF